LPAGTEMVMPGDNVSLVIELITPVAKAATRWARARSRRLLRSSGKVRSFAPLGRASRPSPHKTRLAACRQIFPLGRKLSREGQRE
jgi:hypothetical protein